MIKNLVAGVYFSTDSKPLEAQIKRRYKDFIVEEITKEKEICEVNYFLEEGKEDKDLYGRSLRYIFIENEEKSINEKLVEIGYANSYYPSGYDQYSYKLINAWEKCIKKQENLCEKSKEECSSCLKLNEFDVKTQEIALKNECEFSCNLTLWNIKDEGRKKFIFPEVNLAKNKEITVKVGNGKNTENELYWKGEEYVWTKTGDTLFLRDDKEKLVMWKGY